MMPFRKQNLTIPAILVAYTPEIVKPACELAGFQAERGVGPAESHFVIVNVLRSIVRFDVEICDLSPANPNVL